MKKISVVLLLLISHPLFADVKVHVIDTGPGLATVNELKLSSGKAEKLY